MHPFKGRRIATRHIPLRALLPLAAAAALSLAAPTAVWAQHGQNHDHRHHGAKPPAKRSGSGARHAGHGRSASDLPAVAEYKAAHDRMMRAMDLPYTGDPDVDFRTHMIPHHAGAMDMARVAMRHAKDPWTGQLAESVIYEQQREITEMQGWLARRGVAAPRSGQPYHVLTTGFVRTEPKIPGTRDELVGQAWAPGLGIPARR